MATFMTGKFTIGDINVSPSQNKIEAQGVTLHLQPKVMSVLAYLATHQDRVISKEELINTLWDGRVSHGSVQKSINSLRKAIAELAGPKEVIANYSKKGYQLLLEPLFEEAIESPLVRNVASQKIFKKSSLPLRFVFIGLAALFLAIAIFFIPRQTLPQYDNITKQHSIVFHTKKNYISGAGQKRMATPHPNNQHLAYIQDIPNANNLNAIESKLLIQDRIKNKTWQISSTSGSWYKLAWSPDKKHLLAVEVFQLDGHPLTPDFHTTPDDLYNIYVISLDLESEAVLNRALVTQWQGHIYSVSWWDDTTLEFTAKQGVGDNNQRYRLSLTEQKLKMLDPLNSVANPFFSTIQNKHTAVASYHAEHVDIDFFDENQYNINTLELDFSHVDISWIPDGSGLLVLAEQQLFTLYLDGELVSIPFEASKNELLENPFYQSDGKSIYVTHTKQISNIWLQPQQSQEVNITKNNNWNYAAAFSHTGERMVYASLRKKLMHIWVTEGHQERQLTENSKTHEVEKIIWSNKDNYIIYKSNNTLYRYSFINNNETTLLENANLLTPITYAPSSGELIALKRQGGNSNIWRINTKTKDSSQLTFGSIGSLFPFNGNIYFQYVNKNGLWALRKNNGNSELITATLEKNKKILSIDSNGVYFVSGGHCKESDIFYLSFNNNLTTQYSTGNNSMVDTLSFNSEKGALRLHCNMSKPNIAILK